MNWQNCPRKEGLINFLQAYKSKMEYLQAINFDGDRAAQCKELRKEMAQLYEIEVLTLFGPVSLSTFTKLLARGYVGGRKEKNLISINCTRVGRWENGCIKTALF